MASSPVKFFSILLVVSVIGWILFVFSSRLLAWFLSRTMGASVGFRVAGCNCLRDVAVKFKKGAIESVSIGEIKLSLRKSLVKLGCGFISRDPKLQLLICDIEVVMRSSKQSNKTSKSKKSRSAGKGKWMVLTNVARLISVSVTDLVVKVPKSFVEVKDLSVDTSKIAGSNQILRVKSLLKPFLVQLGDARFSFDQMLNCNQRDSLHTGQPYPAIMERNSVPFVSKDLSIVCDLGHDRENGVKIFNLDFVCGDVTVDLNEDLFLNANTKLDIGSDNNAIGGPSLAVTATKKSQENKPSFLSIKKHIFLFPEKVSFSMPKLDLKFMHRGEDLVVENNIMGIHLSSSKSISYEDSGETTSHFDVQMDLSEIHLLREGTTSILEILKVAAVASIDIPTEPLLPIRAEVDVKLGGTQCNLIMSRLKPWLHLQLSKKKRMMLGKENSRKERSQPSDLKAIMWTCTVSAPEMTIVLYDINGLPLYHEYRSFSYESVVQCENKKGGPLAQR